MRFWIVLVSPNGVLVATSVPELAYAKTEVDEEHHDMINTILDACQFVLEDQGEAQSSFWLSSLMMELKLWRASQSKARAALDRDIKQYGESSPFIKVGEDLYALRSWKSK
jgi:hypothetical protein